MIYCGRCEIDQIIQKPSRHCGQECQCWEAIGQQRGGIIAKPRSCAVSPWVFEARSPWLKEVRAEPNLPSSIILWGWI